MNPQLKQRIHAFLADPHVQGWCTPEKAEYIAILTLDAAPKQIVEIGVFGGKSLVPFAMAAQSIGGHVTGIDPWSKEAALEGDIGAENAAWWGSLNYEEIYEGAVGAVSKYGAESNTTILRMKDTVALPLFADESIDILHVDGNHSEAVSQRYINQWGTKLRKGGYLIMDDTDWASQAATVKLIESRYSKVHSAHSWAVYQKT